MSVQPDLEHRGLLETYLRPQMGRVIALTVLLFAGIGLQIVGPIIMRAYIDGAGAGEATPMSALYWLAGIFIGANLFTQVVQIGAVWFSEQVGWSATNQLRGDLARHVLHLDLTFHNARTPGELIERLDGDIIALAGFFSQFVIQILGSAVLLVGIVGVLAFEDWRVGMALGVFTALGLWALHSVRRIAVDGWMAEAQARSDLSGFLEERIGGLDDIRANGGADYVMTKMRAATLRMRNVGIWAGRRGNMVWQFSMLVFTIGGLIPLVMGAWLYERGETTLGGVYLLVQLTSLLMNPLMRIGSQLQMLQQATASLTRVRELQGIEAVIKDGPGAVWGDGAPLVEFKDVVFAYDERAPVLAGVSLTIEPGKILGLLGRTGAGKSTLIRLLCRLYDPDGGAILLDGIDVRQATLAQLRGHIGVVTQDVQLFQGTVRENASLFDASIADARIIEVMRDLGLGPWFDRLPQGLDSFIAGAGGLSAGEAQLLAFTRVFLQDPGLVVLDEPSSRLDPVTDRLIERAVDKLLRPYGPDGHARTAIVIAHKLATVGRADRILILQEGQVLETGDRYELASDPRSHFYQLLRTGLEEVLA